MHAHVCAHKHTPRRPSNTAANLELRMKQEANMAVRNKACWHARHAWWIELPKKGAISQSLSFCTIQLNSFTVSCVLGTETVFSPPPPHSHTKAEPKTRSCVQAFSTSRGEEKRDNKSQGGQHRMCDQETTGQWTAGAQPRWGMLGNGRACSSSASLPSPGVLLAESSEG